MGAAGAVPVPGADVGAAEAEGRGTAAAVAEGETSIVRALGAGPRIAVSHARVPTAEVDGLAGVAGPISRLPVHHLLKSNPIYS